MTGPTDDRVLCAQCVEEGERSKVYSRGASRTAMGGGEYFWDEDGVKHSHDPNYVTTTFSCSRGHEWLTRLRPSCPAPGCDDR